MEEQKNYPLLIKAFAKFCEHNNDYILNIFGRGSLESSLRDLIQSLSLDNKIFLKGFSKNIDDEIKSASIYVLSSFHEGMPNSLLEAISLGTPSISTDANPGGPKIIISKCKGSILIKNNDIDSLTNALIEMSSKYNYYFELAQKDAVIIRNEFSINTIGNKWINYFTNLQTKK